MPTPLEQLSKDRIVHSPQLDLSLVQVSQSNEPAARRNHVHATSPFGTTVENNNPKGPVWDAPAKSIEQTPATVTNENKGIPIPTGPLLGASKTSGEGWADIKRREQQHESQKQWSEQFSSPLQPQIDNHPQGYNAHSNESTIGRFIGDKVILPVMPYVAGTLIVDGVLTSMSRGSVSFPITRSLIQGSAVLGEGLIVNGFRMAGTGTQLLSQAIRSNPRVSLIVGGAAAAAGYLYYKFG